MPNHCYNQVNLMGDATTVALCAAYLTAFEKDEDGERSQFEFRNVIPEPDGFVDEEGNVVPGWYAWRVENWGTKWAAWNIHVSEYQELGNGDVLLSYSFITAWSPCLPVIDALAEKWPSLKVHHSWTEEFGQFSGWTYYEDGERVEQIDASFDLYTASALMDPVECMSHFESYKPNEFSGDAIVISLEGPMTKE